MRHAKREAVGCVTFLPPVLSWSGCLCHVPEMPVLVPLAVTHGTADAPPCAGVAQEMARHRVQQQWECW